MSSSSAGDKFPPSGMCSRPLVGSLTRSVGVGTSCIEGSKRAVTTSGGGVLSREGVQLKKATPSNAHRPKYFMLPPLNVGDGDRPGSIACRTFRSSAQRNLEGLLDPPSPLF